MVNLILYGNKYGSWITIYWKYGRFLFPVCATNKYNNSLMCSGSQVPIMRAITSLNTTPHWCIEKNVQHMWGTGLSNSCKDDVLQGCLDTSPWRHTLPRCDAIDIGIQDIVSHSLTARHVYTHRTTNYVVLRVDHKYSKVSIDKLSFME